MYSSTLSLPSSPDEVGGQRYGPAALPPGNTRYPLYRSLGGPNGRSGRVQKISPTPRCDPRNVQPISSSYTDWATPAQFVNEIKKQARKEIVSSNANFLTTLPRLATEFGAVFKVVSTLTHITATKII
jgi:hypothetical protein